ncbi:MAG: LacI family DNA-binding transcriptional regulator [Lentisphaeria bacterium]|nr:LacI family DNA-binding transcriptional regulator [Lentisphaeria bacterium]
MRKKAAFTLAEIAQKAGVSISTVSRCLNNQGDISPETRRKILALARATPVAAEATDVIAVILPGSGESMGWYMFSLFRGLRKIAEERGKNIEFIPASNLRYLKEHNFSAIISMDYFSHLETILGPMSTIPVICLNNQANPVEQVYSICSDESFVVEQSVTYLFDFNHRSIALLLGFDDHSRTAQLREEAFFRAMTKFQLSAKSCILRYVSDMDGVVDTLLKKEITAVIAPSESASMKLLQTIRLAGCKIPQDLSLIVGEIPHVSEYQEPPLSTVEHDFEKIALCAFDSIEKRLRGEKIPILQEMPYLLHKRKSVGVTPLRSPDLG